MQPHLTTEQHTDRARNGIQAFLLWSAYGMNEAYVVHYERYNKCTNHRYRAKRISCKLIYSMCDKIINYCCAFFFTILSLLQLVFFLQYENKMSVGTILRKSVSTTAIRIFVIIEHQGQTKLKEFSDFKIILKSKFQTRFYRAHCGAKNLKWSRNSHKFPIKIPLRPQNRK